MNLGKKIEIRNKNYIDQTDPITNMQIYEEGANTKRALKSKIFSNRITLNSDCTEED